jgi:hypothetical protein
LRTGGNPSIEINLKKEYYFSLMSAATQLTSSRRDHFIHPV